MSENKITSDLLNGHTQQKQLGIFEARTKKFI